jgi:hypothetical protein
MLEFARHLLGETRMKAARLFRLGVCAALLFMISSARAADEEAIRKAISAGVEFLKKEQDKASGTWSYPGHPSGATALAGLTLLECGIASNDPVIEQAARAVRPASLELTDTYSLSLAILFLDRLGNPGDQRFIESMAVRLLAGQNSQGGWSYHCPPPSRQELTLLGEALRNPQGAGDKGPAATKPGGVRGLSPETLNQLKAIRPQNQRMSFSDNSNTKFATLALWVARRHGIPVGNALKLVAKRFRTSQNRDGGWGYIAAGPGPRGLNHSVASMTCAGLLGLAIGKVSELTLHTGTEPAPTRRPSAPVGDPTEDPAVRNGLNLLAAVFAAPPGGSSRLPLHGPPFGDNFYSLWAIERVAVAYSLKTIGGHDWYEWGSEYLVAQQQRDGSWAGLHKLGGVDTCFALLFLTRANLSRDLTLSLVGQKDDDERLQLGQKGKAPATQDGAPASKKPSEQSAKGPARESPTTPASDLDRKVARLRSDFLQASADRQTKLIEDYREQKGVEYTQALAGVIAGLKGTVRNRAREALAQRLARMTGSTLRARLKDEDLEMRRAAALACAIKDERSYVPDLVGLLEDSEPPVAHAAHAALKSLTSKDFGPAADASRAERARALAAWKDWWTRQSGNKEPLP